MGMVTKAVAKMLGSGYRVYHEIIDGVAKERRLRLDSGEGWSWLSRRGAAGKAVNLETAMQLSTFWAGVRLTAQAISTMALDCFQKLPNGSREKIDDSPLALVLSDPNLDQTAQEYWESVVAWLCVDGNACSEISRVGKRISALNILPNCYAERSTEGVLSYKYNDRGKLYELPRDKVFHVKGFGFGGDCGLSAIRYGIQTFSTAIAAGETSGKMFSNGMQPHGILTSENTLKPPQRTQLEEIMKKYVSSENAGKLMILESGLKYERLALSPVDAQLMEQQRFSVEEICRWLGIPPIIVGHAAQGQTMWGTGVTQIMLAWQILGLNPIANRIEGRITKQLIEPGEKRRSYFEFNRESLMQMDPAAKAEFLSKLVQNGLMDRNEGRGKLNMSKSTQKGADDLTAQSNLAPLDKLGAVSANQPAQIRNLLRDWLGVKEPEPETKHETIQ